MDRLIGAGFKLIGACPSADGTGPSIAEIKAAEFCFTRMNERPEAYKIVRTSKDTDDAITENKLSIKIAVDHRAEVRHLGPRALATGDGVVPWVVAQTLADHLEQATAQNSWCGATEPSVIDELVRLCDTVERCATSDLEREAATCRRLEVLAVTSRLTTDTGSER